MGDWRVQRERDMARAIWSGSISFGLVNVPVKVYTAVRQKEVRFHQLHDADGARLQYKRVCSVDGKEVPYEHIVKGYEIAPDEYVMITPEELESLDPDATRMIDIEDFVDLADIDPLYFDKSYYLAPNTGGSKAYRVLLESMRAAGKVAIGRVVLRTKQYMVALRPAGDALVMSTLNYHDEIVDPDDVDGLPKEADAGERELKMAQQLIEALSAAWQPDQYRDEYRERVLALIEAKAEGKEVVSAPVAEEPTMVGDLMAALEQSLMASRTSKGKGDGKGKGKATPTNGNGAAADSSRPKAKAPARKPAAKKAAAKK
jgi:DNA end-binding protein Ku